MNDIATVPGEGGLPKITATSDDGARIEAYVHGAHVASWRAAGSADERLYVSPKSHFAPGMPIRGGIPVCFPQFADRGPLPQHGFVRDRAWTPVFAGRDAQGAARLELTLTDAADTRALWPHAFSCTLVATARGSTLAVELAFTNTGDAPVDITAALHTYLRVQDVRTTVLTGLAGARYFDKRAKQDNVEETQARVSLALPLDRVYYVVPAQIDVVEPARTLHVRASGSTDTVVWNPGAPTGLGPHDMPDDGFVSMLCVEAAIARAPLTLAPGATHRLSQVLTA